MGCCRPRAPHRSINNQRHSKQTTVRSSDRRTPGETHQPPQRDRPLPGRAHSPLANAQVPSLDARVDIDIVERDLSEVVQYLPREVWRQPRDPRGGGTAKVKTLKLSDVYWRDALDYAAESAGCVVEEDKSGVPDDQQPRFASSSSSTTRTSGRLSPRSRRRRMPTSSSHPRSRGTIRLRLKNVPWRDALEQICEARGLHRRREGAEHPERGRPLLNWRCRR